MRPVQLRELNVGCFGGGTGLPSLIGGLQHNPWVNVNAVVTMFDSGGSSGQLRDQLGVLPPGDVLKCALALARDENEARNILLSRVPGPENGPLGGHTGGNLLLSMMEQYSNDFLAAVVRLAYAMAWDLKGTGVTAVAITPGFLRSEAVLEHFGVTEENWRDAIAKDQHFAESETPHFVGRAIAALAADPHVDAKAGQVLASWTLAEEYGFDDVDGRRPNWGRHFDRVVTGLIEAAGRLTQWSGSSSTSDARRRTSIHSNERTRRVSGRCWPVRRDRRSVAKTIGVSAAD